jgi:hypothetical protein
VASDRIEITLEGALKLEFNEPYYFLRMYSVDFSTARGAIKVLKRYRRPDVQYALLRDLIVVYVRPFSTNQGPLSKHTLSVKQHVPTLMKPLHNELVRVRMEQFAHTDLTYYSPETLAFKGPNGEFHGYAMMFKGYDYAALLNKLPQIEELVRAVESSVNAEIAKQEAASSTHGPEVPIPPSALKKSLENLTEKSE